jgi:hypothetical protein
LGSGADSNGAIPELPSSPWPSVRSYRRPRSRIWMGCRHLTEADHLQIGSGLT